MPVRDDEDIVHYYQRELAYLRQMGAKFANDHKKLAPRLELTPNGCDDPHVERLLESFAFMTARLQRSLDAEFPEITSALLGVLYPHLVNPIPPMSMASFQLDPKKGKITTGYNLPRHTPLLAQSGDGLNCRFRTCYPVTLWPLKVTSAFERKDKYDFLSRNPDIAGVLRLRITGVGAKLDELEFKNLRFHLHGDPRLTHTLYELLFCYVDSVVLLDGKGQPTPLPPDSLRPVGFGLEEEVIPYPPHSHPGYRLLQEYFALPQKFLFFDLANLERRRAEQDLDVLFLLSEMPRRELSMPTDTFQLGCTPIVNLFARTTEPIHLDHRKSEYRLVADVRRERITEIHSILSVTASSNPREQSTAVQPFYSFSHDDNVGGVPQAYWHSRRAPAELPDLSGTDVYLSFLDLNFKHRLPAVQTVYAHVLCTNRDLALELHENGLLQMEETGPIARTTCLMTPTLPALPPLQGTTAWALISSLSLNFLSFSTGQDSLKPLKEILKLYSFADRFSPLQQVDWIYDMVCRPIVRRMGDDAWRGFCRGTEVILTFEDKAVLGSGAFLLAAVLQRFFALYASVNSFVQLSVRRRSEKGSGRLWKTWPPVGGEQPLL
jgi:type VI secretion system protein ImpG